MLSKEILSYVGGVAAFVVVSSLLRKRITEEFAFGIGALAMLLVGFPFTRFLSAKSGKRLTFGKWVLFSTLGAIGSIVIFAAINRF
jgi:hypothetical protein